MILTTKQAAAELGVTPAAVRKMVERGDLEPISPGAAHLRFRLLDVLDVGVRRMTAKQHARLDSLSEMLDIPRTDCHTPGGTTMPRADTAGAS